MWDKEAADRYESWYQTPKGAFALAREQRLLAEVLSPWHRRNQTLLEMGCGAGHFLELFYAGGFDVTGIDASEAMLEKARERMGAKATLRTGNAEHLPFDDGEFHYVAMVTALECMENPEAALAEAFRVAVRGVVIVYLNAWSLYRLEHVLRWKLAGFAARREAKRAARAGLAASEPRPARTLQRARWFSLPELSRIIYKVSGKRPSVCRSTLFPPSALWRGLRPFSLPWAQRLPFGAVSVLRVDIVPVSVTPMALRSPMTARAARAPARAVTLGGAPRCKP